MRLRLRLGLRARRGAAHLEGALEREAGVAVGERGDLLLLEQRHLRREHAEVAVRLEQLLRQRVGVLGQHDRERQHHRLARGLARVRARTLGLGLGLG